MYVYEVMKVLGWVSGVLDSAFIVVFYLYNYLRMSKKTAQRITRHEQKDSEHREQDSNLRPPDP